MTDRLPRILCIDDDATILEALELGLSESGFEVDKALDGPRGIDSFMTRGADLILLDLGLPGMDGISVCHALKKHSPETFTPVIFLTGRSDVQTKVRVLEEGGDDFCAKPFSLEELIARIHVLLRTRERELKLQVETRRFRALALTDPLTEIGNRRAFDLALDREWSRMERSGRGLGCLIADIDRFKAFNDRYGHKTGDEVLRGVGQSIAKAVRQGDDVFRFGGEEFAILLPEASPTGALVVAERIRRAVATQSVGALAVTVSIGLAVAPDPAFATKSAFVENADRALYEAKAAGRNRVVSTWAGVPS